MPVSIRFEKAKVEHFLSALANGKPIEGVKSADDVLALAGACFFSALSRSSSIEQRGDDDESDEPRTEDAFIADLHAAVEYYAQLSMLLATGDYDQAFEPYHQAIVAVEGGEKTVTSIEGMRGDALEVTTQ